jgi:heme oxygenase
VVSRQRTDSIRHALRNETRESHEELEKFVQSSNLFGSAIGYRVYLASMLRVYQTFAKPLLWVEQRAELEPITFQAQSCIQSDLGSEFDSQSAACEPVAPECCWGTAYVIEGSSMGAKVLLRSISQKPDRESYPVRYLNLIGEHAPERWPKFLRALEVSACDPTKTAHAARRAFELVHEIFVETNDSLESTQKQ